MNDYLAPLQDMRFAMQEIAGLRGISDLKGFAAAECETAERLLASGARFYQDVWAPSNRPADLSGAYLDEGRVHVHQGFHDIYRRTMEGGWNVLPRAPGCDDDGVPWLIHAVFIEMAASANGSLSMLTGLIAGAVELLQTHASVEQQALYIPKLLSGQWAGTMNLSEPDAGSDLGALRTQAIRQPDGTYRLRGVKRYISWGDHDLAENIVHLVLARTPDAPAGTAGISCFIAPKFLVNADGTLGDRNDMRCLSVEQNLGFRASPTCVMGFGDRNGAVGYLAGRENSGMRIMFTMMNSNRLATALGALGICERAYQAARAYAQVRIQGRPHGCDASSPIVHHADVRRNLMTMRCQIEAMRALCYLTAATFDKASHPPDEAQRREARALADLLTPVAKSWCTDVGNEVTSLAIQIFGGAGFVEESGVAQHYRDIRIMSIFEGSNGIQAQDLVGRKLSQAGGETVHRLLIEMTTLASELRDGDDRLREIGRSLESGIAALKRATDWMFAHGGGLPLPAAAGATAYQRLFGGVLAGHLLARGVLAAHRLRQRTDQGGYSTDYLEAKIASARFFSKHLLASACALEQSATAGADEIFGIVPEAL
jgi:alkylation response protein AidB-like acyl-CoA dehydrogenase